MTKHSDVCTQPRVLQPSPKTASPVPANPWHGNTRTPRSDPDDYSGFLTADIGMRAKAPDGPSPALYASRRV
jgi:hypothetical protein